MGVTFIDIEDENDVGQRIDNFLMRRLKGVPKQKIYSILRKGEVRVNSGRVKQTYRLKAQDRVRIPPVATRAEAPVQLNDETEQLLEASILLEDKDFIAINKPYGFAVHGGSSINEWCSGDAAGDSGSAGVSSWLTGWIEIPQGVCYFARNAAC